MDSNGASLDGPSGIAVYSAADKLYVANYGAGSAGTISYMNLDNTGGGGQLAVAGATADKPVDPILLLTPSATGAPTIAGEAPSGTTLSCSQASWAPDIPESHLYQAPASVSYSWTLNGSPIAGAASDSLTPTSAGQYVCEQTATNQAGSTTQSSTAYTVVAPATTTTTTPAPTTTTTTPTTTATTPTTTATTPAATPAPSCTLKARRREIYTSATAARKHRAKVGQLQLVVKCNQAASLTLTGTATAAATKGKNHKRRRTFTIRSLHHAATAGRTLTVSVKLPATALSALEAGRRESVAFKLRAASGPLARTTRLTIGRLRLR